MIRLVSAAMAVVAMNLGAVPAGATVLATCSGSLGQARYDGEVAWTSDGIASGTFTFLVDDKNKPNVVFTDTRGGKVDAVAAGAEIYVTFVKPEQFGFVVVYEGDGLVETYNVFKTSEGKRLFWTSNKATTLRPAKVAAFSSECV